MASGAQGPVAGRPKPSNEAEEASGRRRAPQKGARLNRTRLSERLKLDRKTVSKYLAMPGAPKADRRMLYSVRECRDWFDKVAPRLPNNSDEYRALTLAIKRMEKEDMELDLRERRRELVDKKSIEPTVFAVMATLTERLRAEFELRLPHAYAGKTVAECAKLNLEAIVEVMTEFKTGVGPLLSA